jgi:hypothetical protein
MVCLVRVVRVVKEEYRPRVVEKENLPIRMRTVQVRVRSVPRVGSED